MNKNTASNDSDRKRKKNLRKTKKLKRPKPTYSRIFEEASFDSSDENETSFINESPSKKSADVSKYDFKLVANLTPSKSESERFDVTEVEEVDMFDSFVVDNEDVSCVLNEESSDTDRNEGASYSYSSITEEFVSNEGSTRNEIISADINDLQDTDNSVEIKERRKKLKTKKIKKGNNVSYVRQEFKIETFQNSVSTNHSENLFDHELQSYHTNDGLVVILQKNQTVHFHGFCLLSVLHGQVEILGHILTKNSPEAKLYSPRGCSLLYLSNVTESEVPVTDYLFSSSISKKIKFTEKCAIVLCKKLNDPDLLFIEKHISQQVFPKENPNLPRVVFQPKEGHWNLLQVNKQWNDVIVGVVKTTKLMICGGKGVGKTTFLRYALNRLLMKFKEVRVIDLDPGQSEFTIPGNISVVRVSEPVFGVNYTHLKKPERSIPSNINIAYEPDKYLTSVRHLINTNLDEIPTLINYMGYTHGIGINILSAVISCIQPTDILQIFSQDSKKNYKVLLKSPIVRENAKLFVPNVANLSYKLHQIVSMCDQNDGWTAEPRQLREMSTLAYISQMIGSDSIFKSKAPMYRVHLDDITISGLNGEKLHPSAVNACLVALCVLESQEGFIYQCFGFGIVRGIDFITNEMVLLTNEKVEVLDKITHLVSNGVTLPPSVYMTPDEVTGPMPYVIEGVLMSFGQIPKRSRISTKSVN